MAHFNRDEGHERSIIQSIEIFQRGKGQKSNINQARSGAKSRHTRQEATWLKSAAFTHSIRMEAQLDEVVQVMAEALRNKVEQECGVVDDEHHEHDHCR